MNHITLSYKRVGFSKSQNLFDIGWKSRPCK